MRDPGVETAAAGLQDLLDRETLYIGGAWEAAAAGSMPVIDPATERTIGQLALGSTADLEIANANANATVYGLGAQVQSRDLDAARAVARRIRAGQVHINYPAWRPDAPFGGYKRSGNGREYGQFGFEEYLETKAVLGYEPRQPV